MVKSKTLFVLIFIEIEFSIENLLFWEAIEKFRQKYSSETAKEEANKIFNKFLSPDCLFQINVDYEQIQEITEALNQPNPNMFDDAQDFVFKLMQRGSFVRWKKFHQSEDHPSST